MAEKPANATGGNASPLGPSLAEKIAKIADQIGEKDAIRHSRDIKFAYHAAKDVYGWWRPLLHAQGLIIVPRAEKVDVMMATLPRSGGGTRTTFLTTVLVAFVITDGATGEVISGSAVGQGEDPSDKGAGKAMTYAEKAFLLGMGMNGSESDVEAYDNDRDSRSDEPRRVVVTESSIEGIERGGRSPRATDVQVRRVRDLARELQYGAQRSAGLVEDVLDIKVSLPGDPEEDGPAFVKILEGLPADDIGKLIQYMEGMREPEEAGGYGS